MGVGLHEVMSQAFRIPKYCNFSEQSQLTLLRANKLHLLTSHNAAPHHLFTLGNFLIHNIPRGPADSYII